MAKKPNSGLVLSIIGIVLGLAGTIVSGIASERKTQATLEELVNKKFESK